mgnify:CR=1 FL=1
MPNLVKINDCQITVKEYHDQRVVTFKDIDLCHNRPEGTARKRFNDNHKHLIRDTDYFIAKPADIRKSEKRTSGISPEDVNNRGTALITESGYLMLVKSFTDDLAWQVQRQLVNTYFKKGQADNSLKLQIQQERAHAMLMNARCRALKTISKTLGDKKLSKLALEVFGLTAIEEVTGQKIDYRPECDKLYSAQDLATEIGTSRNMIGRKANAAGIKTDEYGMTVLSKSEHSPKQVDTFMYNECGRAKIKELFGKEDLSEKKY